MQGSILPRQLFKVTYLRRGDSNTWSGSLDRGQVFRKTEATGVIGHGSCLGRGMAPTEEDFAVVTVLVACDPCLFEPGVTVDPFLWESMALYARMLADASLRDRHPGARIEAETVQPAVAGTSQPAEGVVCVIGSRGGALRSPSGPDRANQPGSTTCGCPAREPPPPIRSTPSACDRRPASRFARLTLRPGSVNDC